MNREILFRGQNRKYGEKVTIGTGEKLPGQWVYGGIFPGSGDFSIIYGWEAEEERTGRNIKKWTVHSDTVGQYTGLTDKNGVKIFEGDIVRLFEHIGTVTNECGAFGIEIMPRIDWDCFEQKIKQVTHCDNTPEFCFNDNYVSLWELMWNYNQEDDFCDVVVVLGNIHDNPELLEEV